MPKTACSADDCRFRGQASYSSVLAVQSNSFQYPRNRWGPGRSWQIHRCQSDERFKYIKMEYYFLVAGISLIASSVYLLWYRMKFIRTAEKVSAKVARVRKMNFASSQSEEGPSKHIEVMYTDENGETQSYISDNSLLAFKYEVGDLIELAISDKKVLINTSLNIVAAPIALFILGVMTLTLYLLVA